MVEAEERQQMVDAIDMALAPRKENQGNQDNQGDHSDCEDRKGEWPAVGHLEMIASERQEG